MNTTVAVVGRNTFYFVDIDKKSYTVEEMYDGASQSAEFVVENPDGEEVTEEEKTTVLKVVTEYKNEKNKAT